ncbi:hypothetical protein SUGI_0054910 [Cryptomeria japonica]|nr:hypothetical protein SUGI_0054910 [Cryptomeria japonica]
MFVSLMAYHVIVADHVRVVAAHQIGLDLRTLMTSMRHGRLADWERPPCDSCFYHIDPDSINSYFSWLWESYILNAVDVGWLQNYLKEEGLMGFGEEEVDFSVNIVEEDSGFGTAKNDLKAMAALENMSIVAQSAWLRLRWLL